MLVLEAGERELLTRLRLLWDKRVLFLGKATLAGFVLAAIIARFIPSTYEANVQLMPPG